MYAATYAIFSTDALPALIARVYGRLLPEQWERPFREMLTFDFECGYKIYLSLLKHAHFFVSFVRQ